MINCTARRARLVAQIEHAHKGKPRVQQVSNSGRVINVTLAFKTGK